ncbi:hypothetical protein NDU88_011035 [Pleurodeles waltl]|uniref:Uncharacterized protein n=1 Tax=Pleurodeles waltl TaxID=8319 RepID=A0AAV7R1W5_PLEWA|nr:hypothetical protein NDU88_011035 [Pleurodeles waltl]
MQPLTQEQGIAKKQHATEEQHAIQEQQDTKDENATSRIAQTPEIALWGRTERRKSHAAATDKEEPYDVREVPETLTED